MQGDDPIDRITWRDASELRANAWNPNNVMSRELRLLEHSLLTTGWMQPLLISGEGTIIDGFHRWQLALRSKPLLERYAGRVPCVELEVTEAEAKLLTVRINRAKGVHAALRLSELVQSLLGEHGMSRADVATGLGATPQEVDFLEQGSLIKAKSIEGRSFSKAWVPEEKS